MATIKALLTGAQSALEDLQDCERILKIAAVLWFGLSLGVVTVSGGMVISVAIGVAAVATLLEVFSWGGLDNLTVPLLSSGLCYWLLI